MMLAIRIDNIIVQDSINLDVLMTPVIVPGPTRRAFVSEAALLGHPAGSHVARMDDEPDPVHAFGLEQVAHQQRDGFGCYAFAP